jgi:hypothetical protein
MRSPHRWLIAGAFAVALTAGAQTPAAQDQGQAFDYYSITYPADRLQL